MRSITPLLTPELERFSLNGDVAKGSAVAVSTYKKLVSHVAKLAYLNKDHLLFFRGQTQDYRNKAGASSFYPTIYRGERVSKSEIKLRFDVLRAISGNLCNALDTSGIDGHRDVRKRRYIQWSILQHYEVCDTPLLDITHSLSVACSFALKDSSDEDPFVFVFGLPYITNRISINTEHDIVNVRLLSICPPDALRPYFQDGYVVGTDEITTNYDSKNDLDLKNRLIAKFQISRGKEFWGKGMGPLPQDILYPAQDRMVDLCSGITEAIHGQVDDNRIGEFIKMRIPDKIER